jgi:thiol-disulfide isomerase/thioredoxin
MKKPVRMIVYVVIFAIGMWGGNEIIRQLSKHSDGQQAADAMLKLKAPEYNLPDLNNVVHNSHEWDGKVVILNFWATWCPPCRKETPTFVELQEKYARAGAQFVGIAIDKKAAVQDFMDTYGVNYPMLIGENNAINISKKFGNRFGALPYTVIIDRQGHINLVHRGGISQELAESTIKHLL